MTRQPHYHWFDGATVEELTRQLVASPGCVLEVHQQGDAVYLLVVPQGAQASALEANLLNESHPCPPFCRD